MPTITPEQLMDRADFYQQRANALRAEAAVLPWWRVLARLRLLDRADGASETSMTLRLHARRMLDAGLPR
jgi:hypothetical protein